MRWKPVSELPEPLTRRVALWIPTYGPCVGNWDTQPHHAKPKHYWTADYEHLWGVAWMRTHQPTHWAEIEEPRPPIDYEAAARELLAMAVVDVDTVAAKLREIVEGK